jgi:hypothetical protein
MPCLMSVSSAVPPASALASPSSLSSAHASCNVCGSANSKRRMPNRFHLRRKIFSDTAVRSITMTGSYHKARHFQG